MNSDEAPLPFTSNFPAILADLGTSLVVTTYWRE